MKLAHLAVLAVGVLPFVVIACLTPKQAGDATSLACTLIEAETPNATVESVCAYAPEVAEVAAAILAKRADSGAKGVVACKVIPTTTVCASNAETLEAVRSIKAKR